MAADPTHEADAVEAVRQWVNSARFDEELIELEAQTLRAMLATHDAVAAELERLNKRLTAHTRQIRAAWRAGWDERGLVVTRAVEAAAGGWSEAERRAKAYADESREADAARDAKAGEQR